MSGVSAVMLTYNEEDQIKNSLKSVSWCDEIVIVDSQSTDATREIARSYGARIIDAPDLGQNEPFDQLRQIGVDDSNNDLIVNIDADEIHPPMLQKRLRKISQRNIEDIGVVRAPTCNYFDGKHLKAGAQWPGLSVVVFNSNLVGFNQDVHRYWDFDESDIEDLPVNKNIAVQHNFADSLYDHWQSQRRYAKIAGNTRDATPLRILIAPFWGFYKRVIEQEGWRDGIPGIGIGLCYSWFLFESNFRSVIKTF